jgi:glycosyltransferase involved in cell wall biosynthesis
LQDFSTLPLWNTRKDLLFVGGFDHAPNVDAVLYFCDQILPLIVAEIPDVVFHIVGSRMPDALYDLKGSNVNPIGFVDDLRIIFDKSRVFVAPLRYGAGLKGKVGQSMSFGVPVVGTNVAFEGYSLVNHQEGLVASDPIQFAKAVVQAYTDPSLWHSISSQAWKLIEERFSTQAVQHSVQSLLQTSSL